MLVAGAAVVDVTPKKRLDLSGFVDRRNPMKGVLDGVSVRVLALEMEGERAAVVTVDALYVPQPLADRAAAAVAVECGLRQDAVLVAATHTHSAPALAAFRGSGEVSPAYVKRVERACEEAARQAFGAVMPAEVRVASAPCTVAVNRRMPTPDGVVMAPFMEGPVDESLFYVRVDAIDGAPIAHLVEYGCQPLVLGAANRYVSADYPGALRRMLERERGGTALFLMGCGADVMPVPSLVEEPEAVEDFAERLFESVREAEDDLKTVNVDGISVKRRTAALPLAEAGEEDIARKIATVREAEKSGRASAAFLRAMEEWAEDVRMLKRLGAEPETVPLVLSSLRLGELLFVGIGADVFAEHALGVRHFASDGQVVPVTFVGGCMGPLPTEKAFHAGGYEVEYEPLFYNPLPLLPDAVEEFEHAVHSFLTA